MRRTTMLVVLVGLMQASVAQASLTSLGSFDINPLKPATNSYGGGGVAFIPGGTDSIAQDTLVINWNVKDTIDTTKYNQVFQRITVPGDGGAPTVLATATIRWDFLYDGTNQFKGGVGSDLAFDTASNRLVGMFNPSGGIGGQCFMSFPLFAADQTVSTLGWSQPIADNAQNVVKTTMVRQDGRYVSLYPYTVSGNGVVKVISVDPAGMDGTVALTKEVTAQSEYTGWWPNSNVSPYTIDGYGCEGGTAFGLDSFLLIRDFKNASGVQESHLYQVGNTLDADAINDAVDLGDLNVLNSLVATRVAYGLALNGANDVAYVRMAQHNNIGQYNRILMVGGLPAVPEPASLLLLLAGALAACRRGRGD